MLNGRPMVNDECEGCERKESWPVLKYDIPDRSEEKP
jgi:hypothetical protein